MAGEIQLNSTTMATESSGSITAELDTIRPNTTNGSLTLQGDSSNAGVTGLTIDASGNATFAQTITGGTIGSGVVIPSFVGMVASFAMSSAPTGWLVCNGAEYAIADYGDLHTAIGTTWGALTDGSGGAGSTHFRVPDLRGEFLRGFDNGQGNDPDAASRTGGDAVGSSQGDALKIHNHTYTILDGQTLGAGTPNYRWSSASASWAYSGNSQTQNFGIDNAGTSSENRPRNKNVQYCIKY